MRLNKKILQAVAWLVLIVGLIAAGCAFGQSIELRPASLTAEIPAEGVGRVYNVSVGRENALQDALSGADEQGYSQSTSLKIDTFSRVTDTYLAERCAENEMAAYMLDEYTEGQSPVPEWWRPDEEMAVEWTDHSAEAGKMAEAHPPVGIDPGGVDWNIETEIIGWDGHRMAIWEMDLFSRIVFLEFGITSTECLEAGIDAILRLWESGYYSSTMFGTLSAVAENGKPAFSTFSEVWNEEYDYEKLARIREECEERFVNGPEWTAPFFRTGHYHEWAEPCYAFVEDNVYFSTGKGWQ